ncbi:siderophore-interacting protein [Streptomyces sp. Je 1-4]|uniref:siderophore-interacting protein n=1 Tax=Streptomyces TaxID=1883 RepID=UPI00140F0040|nr:MULTISPECIES: siderophore-interacting protein [unclassified Streptomyces]QIK09656.1 siderophore-interacting protein [Streptomyces sp. ID38640]UYB43370.1 siderophore-interacting protein [Streptomyces sp. Je 1-4]UZQ39745.1 siderophore-interacting protein [Streptomyces sp. Je 1-4] [Streptomyces sp. Je 1-4 4N24]UZQ47162.1 siderophore-interacting protein [Streptomyces sp. Je 1-4] [Streptomyces sp. Je 1-4 4N24_ara]
MAAERPSRKKPAAHRARVQRTEQLTPHMVRVVLGGEGLAEFAAGEYSDHYVKLVFPQPGVRYPEPFDMAQIRAEFPRDQWPSTRTYTVRTWDAATRELTVDFVVHGDEGLAGPWAAAARPGEEIFLLGPGGAYVPEAAADWHLLAGDESALPAIAASLARMPAGVPVHAFIEVAGPEERQELDAPAGAEISWLYRGGAPVGRELVAAVRALDFPSGRVQAFVHGEAGFVKELRRLLRVEREIPREDLSISGYWRTGHDEDGWQASKRDWNQQVEAEQEPTTAAAS